MLPKALIALLPAGVLFVGSVVLFFKKKPSPLFYNCSAQRACSWLFLLTFAKHSTCFRGCTLDARIASVIISISGAPFLVSRCFQ